MDLLGLTEYLDLAPQWIYCLRLLIALLCGVILGAERTFRSKDAGIRTHAILASSAALFMIISKYGFLDLGLPAWSQGFDPTLVAGFIIDGSGFLCAGIICSRPEGDIITGMTSAANIWATAAIGMACGCGLELLGILCALLLLLNHWILSLRGVRIMPLRSLKITVANNAQVRQLLRQAQKDYGIQLISARYSRSDEEGTVQVQMQIRSQKTIRFEDTVRFLDTHPEVKDISI